MDNKTARIYDLQDKEEFCRDLSYELSANYYRVSLGKNKIEEDRNKNYKEENEGKAAKIFNKDILRTINERIDKNKTARNILVLGAGASFDSYDELHLADRAIEELNKNLGVDDINNKGVKEKYDKYREEAEILHGKIDFETQLSILSKIISVKRIRKELQSLYNHRYCPSLFFEIVAHMFKHRFVDVIINFNFDELLEQAIEEEIGEGDYNAIISDGHCLELEELIANDRLKVPLYIKPHGTASHKSTLRFTKDQYFDIPNDISELIRIIVGGYINESENEDEAKKVNYVNLIVVGFGMASLEFSTILKKSLPPESKIWYVTHGEENIPHQNEEILKQVLSRDDKKGEIDRSQIEKQNKVVNLKDVEFQKSTTKLSTLFATLWKCVNSNFIDQYKPRNILRHQIIHDIFYAYYKKEKSKKLDFIDYFKSSSYYYSRSIVEFALALIKSNGVIEIRRLMEERTGVYFDLYRKSIDPKIITSEGETSIFKLVSIFELKEDFQYARTIYNIPNEVIEAEEIYNFVIERLEKALLNGPFSKNKIQLTESSKTIIKDFHDGSPRTDSINPKFNDGNLYIFDTFSKSHVLHTNLALRFNYLEYFEEYNYHSKNSWDVLLAISENGGILNGYLENLNDDFLKDKKVILITAEKEYKLKDKIPDDRLFKFTIDNKKVMPHLPYWAHNHHMAIFMKRSEDTYTRDNFLPVINMKSSDISDEGENIINSIFRNHYFMRSIYFKKSGLSYRINPIVIDNLKVAEGDHQMLLETFLAYLIQSHDYIKSNNSSITNIRQRDIIYSGEYDDLFNQIGGWISSKYMKNPK